MKTIVAEKIVAGGDCIGRLGGKIVFVPYALPGETLAVEITEERKDFACARISSVVAPSSGRVSPRCPSFGHCGGCNLQMAEHTEQIKLKVDLLRTTFARAGFAQPLPDIALFEGSPWEYRSRFQFHRAAATGKQSVGLMPFDAGAQGGRWGRGVPKRLPPVVSLDDCPVAVPYIRSSLRQQAFLQLRQERVYVFAGDSVRSAGGAPIAFGTDSSPVCRWLCESAPPQFRYVSCNPVALARDAVLLVAAGYRLSSLALFDFYPQTSHAEVLAYFETGGYGVARAAHRQRR